MCGIVGYLNKEQFSTVPNKAFKSLLAIDVIRGQDSTGIAAIRDKEVSIYKKAVHSLDLLELIPYDLLPLNNGKTTAVIGHNRAATRGAVSARNAHPFQHEHITLVHNGTLRNRVGLSFNTQVDSDAICAEFSKRYHTDVLEDLDGAYALVWYDQKLNTMFFARNEERPLHFAYVGETVYWASRVEMLQLMAAEVGIKDIEYAELPVGKVYGISMTYKIPLGESWTEEAFTPKKIVAKKHDSNWQRGAYRSNVQAVNGIRVGETIPISNPRELKHNSVAYNGRGPIVGEYRVGGTKYDVESWWVENNEIKKLLDQEKVAGNQLVGVINSFRSHDNRYGIVVRDLSIRQKKRIKAS
jgi:asparagine synthetase B (glutamine-hydrolysing)